MGIMNYHEIDYKEFEIRILEKLVPNHVPKEQWKQFLEGKYVRKERNEEETNQYCEQES